MVKYKVSYTEPYKKRRILSTKTFDNKLDAKKYAKKLSGRSGNPRVKKFL